MRITDISCIDGEKHKWIKPDSPNDPKSYCKKCNSTTEHVYDGRRKNPWIRCRDLKGKYVFSKPIKNEEKNE